ncbi:hypothetical protein BBO99_00006301 [Phytophthora kernoviae]|uniref:Uncharacterized protein n=2 Tax=Phytophthora kernoviae TaxID=325452 RepID=A0A3R7HV20_9STRA|nr:hypothetical protein G195_009941 [Phytophthora kernoviae 00238/432]KAG2511671.1 hypothetical protein JM16_006161 [Phytophthora kernoviae]KAG2513498.1 hypothetical protein JM18_008327 [Phytophthora kernoviae]RLN27029.1 hypothetical protein BBI17_006446 [Phytophthora kernoviae]RLN77995.1 hypothetical protein BBO99_00006301 [Phytophthora kernoviae]
MAGAYLTLTLDENAFYVALCKRLVLHNECCKATYSNDEATKIQRFDMFFAIREMVLVGSLSYQAYQSSYLVPREGLNNLNAAFLILACWVTPLAQVLLRQSTALSRVVPLFSSFVLCTFLAKAVHGILVKSYKYMFDIDHAVFAARMFYDPTFVSILVPENRMMFATTVGDYISKLLPHICSFVTLIMLEGNISRRSEKVTPRTCASTNQIEILDAPSATGDALIETGDGTKAVAESRNGEKAATATPMKNPGSAWPFLVIKFLFIVWGAIVLALHVTAQSRHKVAPLGCFRVTHPWFTSNVSCLGLVYDCAIQGTPSPTNEAFDAMKLESKTLGSLSFTHCPALIVPNAIQSFPNIYSVHIFNSTLYSWGSSAALVEDHHHHLVSVVLIYVKLAAFPEGLMSRLPPTLVNLQFFATSLPSVPSDLGTRWGVGRNPISRVGFEYGMLTTIPAETFQLPVKSLSLAGNYLYAIPQLSAVAAKTYLPQLILDGNPVLTLPATVDPTFMIGNLCIEGSKLSALPSWTQTQVLSKMFLYESAFCFNTTAAQQEANNSICSVSHWGSTKPKSPIVLMQEVYG